MKLPFGKKAKAAEPSAPVTPEVSDDAAAESAEDASPVAPPQIPSPQLKVKKKSAFTLGAKRARFDEGEAHIGIELENGVKLTFAAYRSGEFVRLDGERDKGVPLVTAYRDDWRVATPTSLPDSKAKGFSARETDALERMAVINESRRGRLYTTPLSGLAAGEVRVPILQVLDEMLAGKKGNFVAGVLMGNHDLAILYAYNDGVMGARRMQISVNPENLEAIASSFVSVSGMPEDTEILLFEQAEFLQRLATKSWTPYPGVQGFYGIPKGALPALMIGVTGMAALGCSAYAGYWYYQEKNLSNLILEHNQKRTATISAIGGLVVTKHHAFVENTSINVLGATAIASLLRNDGGLVEAKLTRANQEYSVFTEFFAPGEAGNDALFRGAIAHQPVDGCTKMAIETTGGMREIKTKYSCTIPGANLARFGW